MTWIRKHWVVLLAVTGGAILLWYLYQAYVNSAASAVTGTTCVPGDPTCDPNAAAALAAEQAAAASSGGVPASTSATSTPLANVLSSASTATPGSAPNAVPVNPAGAVNQPNTSASGVPTYSNQTQQFATNTPPPPTNPVQQASGAPPTINTGPPPPQSSTSIAGESAAQQAYDAAFNANPAYSQTAAALKAAGYDPYLLYQNQLATGSVGPTIGAQNSQIGGLVTGPGVTTQQVLLPSASSIETVSEGGSSTGTGSTGSGGGTGGAIPPANPPNIPVNLAPPPPGTPGTVKTFIAGAGNNTIAAPPTLAGAPALKPGGKNLIVGGINLPSAVPVSATPTNPIVKLPIVKPLVAKKNA